MRQGNTIPTITVTVLTLGIAIYFIVSFWEAMTEAYTTTITYTYSVSDSVDAKGVLLREEFVLPSAEGILDILRSEGEQVGVGQVVGRIYRDIDAMEKQSYLEAMLDEMLVLDYALKEKLDIITVTKVDDDIVAALSSLKSNVVTGNYQNLESQIVSVQGTVLRRDYIFGSAMEMKELEDRYELLTQQVAVSSQVSDTAVSYVSTPVAGAYSILVDGLESVDLSQGFSLADLESLLSYQTNLVDKGTGKIITGNTWYFLTSLPSSSCEDLVEGNSVTLRFSGDFAQDISMKIEEIGREESGQKVLLLSSDRYLEQTTLLRFQTAEIVYQTYTGLRIPKEALRMESYTNSETGAVTEVFGVYVVQAGYADFTPVVILAEGSDFFVVTSPTQDAYSLRAGQEIVAHAVGIYDGKLLFY
ncbi:MAG: HlyD family efflux transporter periplasmic adaptor subunit [Eubacteriales bacterium]